MLEQDQAKQQAQPEQLPTKGEVEAELSDEQLQQVAGGFKGLNDPGAGLLSNNNEDTP